MRQTQSRRRRLSRSGKASRPPYCRATPRRWSWARIRLSIIAAASSGADPAISGRALTELAPRHQAEPASPAQCRLSLLVSSERMMQSGDDAGLLISALRFFFSTEEEFEMR